MRHLPTLPVRARRLAALLLAAAILSGGCARVMETAPAATPGDFPGLASALATRGIIADRIASGDAGCQDAELARAAIRFWAAGADQAAPVMARVYIFRSEAAYDRRRQSVDACALAFITDPGQLQVIDATPFVLVAQGPWAPQFGAAMRSAMREVAARP